jgi:hypothetical protein
MTDSHTHPPVPAAGRLHEFPVLAKLGFIEQDLDVLAGQGCLAVERRGDRRYFKLRFRRDGRQIVRYVGGVEMAALVAEELNTLQATRRMQRDLDRLSRAARRLLRDGKAKLEPLLLERGFKFHGRSIRRPRRAV